MKTRIIILVMFAMFQAGQAQKLITKNAHIWFFSHTPIEDIEAHNRQAVSIIDPSTGEIAFSLLIKSFEFKKAQMQVHFNENYMESDKYPKSTFKGKITNLDKIDFKKDGSYPAEVSGDITVHNVTKPISAKGTIDVKNGAVSARAKFITSPHEFDISIPAVVEKNIAKEIEVTIEASYSTN